MLRGAARRRRSYWRRRALGVAAILVAVSAVAAVVAEATSRSPSRPAGLAQAARRSSAVHRGRASGARTGARAEVGGRAEAGASGGGTASVAEIQKLMRTTPLVTGGTPRQRVIALTFDDGPSPYTPEIVRVLVRLHAPATFFVVGQQLRYFSAGLRDEVSHHFEVGDHTENHSWMIRLSPSAQYFQIHAAAAWMERLGAPPPTLFRPPYGAYDASTLAVMRQLGMLGVLWSVDPGDWRRPGTQWIIHSILAGARPGAIVELHDGGGNRSETAAALPEIVRALRRRHYQLVTVSQLLALDPPNPHQQLPHLSAA